MKGSVPLDAVAPRTPWVEAGDVAAAGDVPEAGELADAGEVAEAGEVAAAGEVAEAGDFITDDVFGDECCAPWTPLELGEAVEVLVFVVELFVTELLLVVLVVTEVFVTELLVVEWLSEVSFVVDDVQTP